MLSFMVVTVSFANSSKANRDSINQGWIDVIIVGIV